MASLKQKACLTWMLSLLSNHQDHLALGDLQQGDEDDDQLLPGQPDRCRPDGHCLGAFSQVDASDFL